MRNHRDLRCAMYGKGLTSLTLTKLCKSVGSRCLKFSFSSENEWGFVLFFHSFNFNLQDPSRSVSICFPQSCPVPFYCPYKAWVRNWSRTLRLRNCYRHSKTSLPSAHRSTFNPYHFLESFQPSIRWTVSRLQWHHFTDEWIILIRKC